MEIIFIILFKCKKIISKQFKTLSFKKNQAIGKNSTYQPNKCAGGGDAAAAFVYCVTVRVAFFSNPWLFRWYSD